MDWVWTGTQPLRLAARFGRSAHEDIMEQCTRYKTDGISLTQRGDAAGSRAQRAWL